MKRLILTLTFMITIFILTAFPAMATGGDSMLPNDYITWEFLGTFAGAVAATTLIVQFLKLQADKVWKIPTRYIVYVIAFLVLLSYQVFFGRLTAQNIIITFFNAIIVTMASMGTYEVTFAKIGK